MKRYIYIMVISFFYIGCSNESEDCNSEILKHSVKDEYIINTTQLFSGFSINCTNKRFQLKCLLDSKGNDVMNMFDIDSVQNDYTFKLLDQYSKNFSSNDSIYCFFWDKRKFIRAYGANNLIKINIKDTVQPCDSIRQIIYSSVSGKIEKLTKEKIGLANLYDKVLENQIQNYLNSLNPIKRQELDECRRTFKLLDWVENSKEYGFRTKEFKLSPEIEDFLTILIKIITEKTSNEKWEHKRFAITIIGYADERSFGHKKQILGSKHIPFIGNNCNDKQFITLNKTESFGKRIYTINNNCELSWMRGFSTALFLEQAFEDTHLKDVIEIKYYGGNISYGANYDVNRKIELGIELKAGTE